MDQERAAVGDEAASDTPRRKRVRRGTVRVFQKWCKGCGLCIAFCPEQVFEADAHGHSVVAHPERCTACEWCYVHCPDCAISVQLLDETQTGGQG